MANPEHTDEQSLSKPGVEANVPVQDGADKAVDRPEAKGKGAILWVSLGLAVVAAILTVRFLF